MYTLPLRLRSLFRRERVEAELDEEMRYHLDRLIEANAAAGMSEEEARFAALRAMHGLEQRKEECRDMRRVRVIENLSQDFRFALRMMMKNPLFTVVVVVTLALSLSATTVVFSVVNALLLRSLPYNNADQLVMLWSVFKSNNKAYASVANFREWQERNNSFQSLAACDMLKLNLTGTDRPEVVDVALVSANLFSLLGVQPERGRSFQPEEEQPGNNHVVVISNSLWQSRFGADANVLGRTFQLDGDSYTVIGVMPPGFSYPEKIDLWLPLSFLPEELADRGYNHLLVVGRLKPGVELRQAQAEMSALADTQARQYPNENAGRGMRLLTFQDNLVGDIRMALWVLTGAVFFVLLIACANVANLLMARATTRQKEIAIRIGVGASRGRLIQQLLTESLLLSMLGALLGLLLTKGGIQILKSFGPANIPRLNEVAIDARVLAFTLGVSLLTAIIFGLKPALQTTRPDINEWLKDGQRTSTAGSGFERVRNWLVVTEVALALILLIGAGLLIKSFMRLWQVEPGFNPNNVLTMSISPSPPKYNSQADVAALCRRLLDQLKTTPNVEAVGVVNQLPFSGRNLGLNFTIVGQPPTRPEDTASANYRLISPGYLQALTIPLKRGRDFNEHDTRESPPVALINEALAKRYFPNEDPIGKQLNVEGQQAPREIIGIIGDLKQIKLDGEVRPEIYVPFLQFTVFSMSLVVRTSSDPSSLTSSILQQISRVDPDQPVFRVKTMDQYLGESMGPRRLSTTLLGAFAAFALLLAAIGVYSVMNYLVSQRRHEIGIRMALGASQREILKLVVGQGMWISLLGIGFGIAAALLLTRIMTSLLYGITPSDPLTYIANSLMLLAVALLACLIPARRAMSVDPIIALRYQ
jgi:putative ABC transport system permease protein